ncbi:MAG TPA: FliM/FliN family flagellar motor C-terminal domain-containing protein [Terracidiphilus sp.]|nr:FliM/FliN family flagellar motor C-terminal domain-containing protein [Terracidiphilus sp.]
MATAHPLPPQPQELARGAEADETPAAVNEDALVAQVRMEPPAEPLALGPAVAALPVELDVAIPVRGFRVKNLLSLEPGSVIETQWNHGEDMPLKAGDVQLAWSEFEVVDARLAVRVTRLA